MAEAPDYVLLWATAVDQQGFRTQDRNRTWTSRLSDAVLFATALRNLLRAVEYAKEQSSDPAKQAAIQGALDSFSGKVPHWSRIRNALEHFDEYDQGRGRGQRTPFVVRWTNSTDGVLSVGDGLEMNVAEAFEAAAELHLAFEQAWAS